MLRKLTCVLPTEITVTFAARSDDFLLCATEMRDISPSVSTLLISRGAILNFKFLTSFAESNLPSCADLITLDPCLLPRHQMSSSKEESKKGQYLFKHLINITRDKTEKITFLLGSDGRNCAVPLCNSYGDIFDNSRKRNATYHKKPSVKLP